MSMRALFPCFLALTMLPRDSGAQVPAPAGLPAQTPSTPATNPALDPADNAKIVDRLARAQKEFEVRKKEIATNALAKFTSGAMSEAAAVQFYFTCQQIVQDRIPDLDGATKQDAKDRQERVKQQTEQIEDSPGRAAVLQMQLQYLVLTMEAPQMTDRGAVISRLKDFASRAVGLVKTYTSPPADPVHKAGAGTSKNGNTSKREIEKQREDQRHERARQQVVQLAQQSVMGSVFAQAYNLQNYFKPVEGWPGSPLDLANAYTGMIIPYYREEKRDFLGPAWDEYINLESSVQRCALDDRAYARWGVGTYKNLQWTKWKDLLQHGVNRVMAADELSKLCTENLSHPSVGGWIEDLARTIETLNAGTSAPTATSTATSTPEPAPQQ